MFSRIIYWSITHSRPQSGLITPQSTRTTNLNEIQYRWLLQGDDLDSTTQQTSSCINRHNIMTHTLSRQESERQHFLPSHHVSCNKSCDHIHTWHDRLMWRVTWHRPAAHIHPLTPTHTHTHTHTHRHTQTPPLPGQISLCLQTLLAVWDQLESLV